MGCAIVLSSDAYDAGRRSYDCASEAVASGMFGVVVHAARMAAIAGELSPSGLRRVVTRATFAAICALPAWRDADLAARDISEFVESEYDRVGCVA